MSNYVLDKAYRILNEGGVDAGVAVVATEGEGTCRIATPDDPHILGITTYSQPREGAFVAVRRLGITGAISTGIIDRGDRVRVVNDLGHLGRCPLPRWSTGSAGGNNSLIFHWADRGNFAAGLALELHDPGESAPFSWSFTGGALRLVLEHDEIEVIQTAASLIAEIEADDDLAALIHVDAETGSTGSGIVAPAILQVENLPETRFPIGIAENGASGAGDIFDVYLAG
ncbi:MAG: hypothetical protein JJU11_11885 [Candidatus Sumerlaeia bacterium]|nr:hypothetical protein [Candidatus Sumerlaeia bacterium]